MTLRQWLLLILTAGLFASAFLLVKIAVAEVPPMTVAAARILCGVPVALLALVAARGPRPPLAVAWKPMVGLGILAAALPFTAISLSVGHIASGLAGIVYGSVPIVTLLIASGLLREEPVTPGRLAGMAVGLGGVVLVVGPAALAGLEAQLVGVAIVFVGAVSHATGAVIMRRVREVPTAMLASGQFVVGALITLPIALVLEQPWTLQVSTGVLLAVLGAGVVSTAIPMLLIVWLVKQVGPTNTALLAFFMPPFAVLFGAAFAGEWVGWGALAGLAAILAGAALAGRPLPAGPKPAAATT